MTVAPAELTLRAVRRLLEGSIPPVMCTVSADKVPHVNDLSHAAYIDDGHVALTYQLLNRSRQNVLATGRVALNVEDPFTGTGVVLQLRYLRTDTEGPVFERLRAKLAGIAAQTGMEKVFQLRGADLYRVESLRKVDPRHPMPGQAPRCDLATGLRRASGRLAEAASLDALLRAFTDALQQDAGLSGVALREGVPIRIGHMTQMYHCGMAWRVRAETLGLQAVMAETIPLPGLTTPRSQPAVPLRARGRSVGALRVEGDRDRFFSYDDEDALAAPAAQLAQALLALRAEELADEAWPPAVVPAGTGAGVPVRVRHCARDHSVFVGDPYLIKGVAGAILARLVRERIATGRDAFTTRELHLAGDDLGLPEGQDNLGVRLLLLERRLAERDFGLRIERTGRDHCRLAASGPLRLDSEA